MVVPAVSVPYGTSIGAILRALASSDSLVPAQHDRAVLAGASAIVDRLERQVEVIIVQPSADVDPIVGAVLDIAEDWKAAQDTLAVIEDRCTDLARLLRRRAGAVVDDEGGATDVP